MAEDNRYQILSLLKREFPGFEMKLDKVYWQDPLFRQIAREFHECIANRDMDLEKKGKTHDIYADTIHELSEELLGHLLKDPPGLSGR